MRQRGIPIACAALLALCSLRALALDNVPGVETVRFRNYSTAEGMSQATAMVQAQDRAGFLWVGTQDGLDRFDGYGFKIYRHSRADASSLAHNFVGALLADPDGSLWVGTQSGGLDRYDPVLDRFEHHEPDAERSDTLAGGNVTALLLDRRARLWVASAGLRLQWLDRASGRFSDPPFGAPPALENVRAMSEQADGTVLIGTRDGLWRCDTESRALKELRFDPAHSLDVQALALADNGAIWVTTTSDGLYGFSADGTPLAHYRHGSGDAHELPDNEVRGLKVDSGGRLWIATKTAGLVLLDPAGSGYRQFRHDPAQPLSLAAMRVQSVLIDRDGLIWAGTWNNGLSMHDPRTEAFASIVPAGDARSVPFRSVGAVLGESDNTLWFGTAEGGGIVRFDPRQGVIEHYLHDASIAGSLQQGVIENIKRTRDGSLWVSTAGGGLSRLPPGTSSFIHFRHSKTDPDSLASDDLLFIMQDRAGTLWIGTVDAGLDELCEGCTRFRHHAHDAARLDSIGSGPIAGLLETSDGEFWVALRPGGLDRYDRAHDRFEHFHPNARDSGSISSDTTTTLMQDSRGELWIGTQGGGLNHRVPGETARFEAITTASGLAADSIGSIVEDANGNLWVSTTLGISRIDPRGKHVINFGGREGALSQGYFLNAWAKLGDGRIVFGGLSGVTIFDPAAVTLPPPPRPILTDVLLNNEPVQLRWRNPRSPLQSSPWLGRDRVVLSHRQDNVSFEFSAFGFGDPESVEYSYLLEGHDPRWIASSARLRHATYTDLPRGDYRLRVRARRDGDAWNAQEATLDVRVLPAPWASPLAILGYVAAALLLALFVFWRARIDWRRRMQAQAAIRASEERLKFALWGSGGELWDVDMRTGTMLRENRLEHLRATRETRSQTLAEYRPYVHPDDLESFEREMAAHIRGEKPYLEASYRTQGIDGEWHWLLTRGRVAERAPNGHALRITGTTQDITTLKRAEEQLRKLNEELELRVDMRTADLRKANAELRHTLEQLTLAQHQLLEAEKMAALGGLVAGVAHEINTPLGVTVTAASHLKEETTRVARALAQNQLTPELLADFQQTASDSAEIILRNLHRADRLIKSFKLIAVDQTTEERRVIELGAYLNDILTSLGPALKKTPHKVKVECAPNLQLNTYPGALYQIVSNLVMNSLIHAFDPAKPGLITISAERSNDHVRLRYRDDGRGMSDAVRTQIFEPFFTTRRGQGGSGLGMHVVYNLVTQLLKGSIRVESTPGAGTTFEMYLPLELPAAIRVATES